ncbi:hypothetical protein BGZ80_009027, partial [Entomortierella chlamydospora]
MFYSSTPNMKPIKPSIVKNALHLLEQQKSVHQVAAEVGINQDQKRYNDENEDPVSANTVRRALKDI